MRVDQDRPSTWKPYKSQNCASCQATCCTMPVEVNVQDLVKIGVISEDEAQGSLKKVARRLQSEGLVKNYRTATGLFMLEQKNGRDCVFLGKDRLCTVYEKRPGVCRGFPAIQGPRIGFCPYLPKRP
ncbi:MAG: YkgJ family cysteine cluster protein [Bdellovibrionota bacterium]